MVLYKRCSTADIFLGIFFFFFDKLFRKTDHSKSRIVDIYLRRMSNYYCFRRAAQVELSQCNRRNNVFRAVVKFNKCLKGTKVFAFWVFCKKSKKFLKIYTEEPLLETFYPFIGFEKVMNTTLNTSARLPLK